MRSTVFLASATMTAMTLVGLLLAGPALAEPPPNIVFIVADDMGWNDIGYHNREIKTPTLDRLAQGGVELDCHYVQPQCTPTRVALLTGRYPSRFGPQALKANNERAVPEDTLTMADMFKKAGYDTALVGKWHLGSKTEWGPNHYGFDYSYGSLAGAVGMYDHRYRLDTPFAQTWHRNLEFIEEQGHATDLVAEEAVRWIKRERNGPFFLYVPFQAVHNPLVEPMEWIERNRHIEDPERWLYAAAVSHLDDAVRRIVEALDQTEQRDQTLIIFSSDNGAQVDHVGHQYPAPDPPLTNFSSNRPLRGAKSQAYEGGIRVPAFVNWPARLQPRKTTAPMHIVDWMPTLARLAGYESEEDPHWDGQNIWPLVSGEASRLAPRTIYTVWGNRRQWEALRHGDWKIVRHREGKAARPTEWELYHLADDPFERTNLAQTSPDRVAQLAEWFEAERQKDAQ